MKITIFGLTISSSWGNGHATPYRAILKALHRRGHIVRFFEKNVPYYAKHRDFSECDFCDLTLYSDWESARPAALACAAESDAVICASFCPQGARIGDDVLELPRPTKIFYDLDTPVTLAALESGEVEYLRREQICAFDLYLSFTGGNTIDELTSRWGARLALPLYGCVDPEVHTRTPVRPELQCELSCMGTYAADRQRDWQFPPNMRRFEHVAPSDHSALYSSSRLTLNITRREMAHWGYCPSGRFFEAAACGTPIVTDWFEGLDRFFDTGRELLVVRTGEEVISAIQLPDLELRAMAAQAKERTLQEHTGEQRARELVDAIEQAANRTPMQRARSEVA